MPLSKARNRERMRRLRDKSVQPACNLNVVQPVQPNFQALKQRFDYRQGNEKLLAKPTLALPVYNQHIHKPGDRVRVMSPYGRRKRWIEVIVPELDVDGNPMNV